MCPVGVLQEKIEGAWRADWFGGFKSHIRDADVSGGSVTGNDEVGGLIGSGFKSHIRTADVSGGSVTGNEKVGGLVGDGDAADIRDADVSGGSVNGSSSVGGLVGNGGDTRIRDAYVSGGSVAGTGGSVGGLVGYGEEVNISYAYVSGGSVAGTGNFVGGLVGNGEGADIRYAYVFGGSVTGDDTVGGLVGNGEGADIRYAYVSGGSVNGSSSVGGLVGDGQRGQIYYSYAATGPVPGSGDIGGLIGSADDQAAVNISYWDTQTTGQPIGGGGLGEGKTTTELQSPTGFRGTHNIYALWGNFWCNPRTGDVTEDAAVAGSNDAFIHLWDLGNRTQYPALSCMPGGLSAQGRVDAFPLDPCADRDTDKDGMPDTLVANCQTNLTEDPDDDDDDVLDQADAFPLDGCASKDTDEDGMPDTVVAGCRTYLTEDSDDDNDGVNDVDEDGQPLDNCPLLANADQTNTDNVSDGGDACDPDDDNDGVNDVDENGQLLDNCPLLANEDQTNTDNVTDGGDACDVDDDNNRLIEIRTLDALARLRDDLNGDGMDDGNIAEITAVGSAGCPSSGCLGYELNRSLNFSNPGSYASGSVNMRTWTTGTTDSGWEPIGSCTVGNACDSWAGVFDGGGYTLADLFVSADNDANGVGLFGAFRGSLQNLHLVNARVSGGARGVGLLAGDGRFARYENLSVTGGSVMSPSANRVGGLVGYGQEVEIRDAYVSGVSVAGDDKVGGLVGGGHRSDIRDAYVSGGSVTGEDEVGGLVGFGEDANISSAYVSGGSVAGDDKVGGLVGDGENAGILSAYVSGGSVAGDDTVGGLVGNGENADILSAYVSGVSVAGDDTVGGLVGDGQNGQIHYSYVATELVPGSGDIGGLLGSVDDQATVIASYWDTQITGQPIGAGHSGGGKTTTELQSPAGFMGTDNIYALWGNFWCNPRTGNVTEDTAAAGPGAPFIRLWDLGAGSQYPALSCTPGGLSAQGRVDAFPNDACASADTDKDGMPDTVVPGCQTNLTEDDDDDDDGVNDFAANGTTQLDACPRGDTGWISDPMTDHDGDGCRDDSAEDTDDDNDGFSDAMDVDDNNNGLIEIRTLDELARLRDDLNGDGTDDGNIAEITAVGSVGCPSSGCLGYELTRSLNFSQELSYGSNGEYSGNLAVWTNRSGSGWEPIGYCVASNDCSAYAGVFDGKGYAVADLFVSAGDDASGVGLFGAFNGSLQNLHLRNVHISGGGGDVGGLVGYGAGAGYENLSVTDGSVSSSSASRVGGLVGFGRDADIRDAYVSGGSVSGRSSVGGLVGYGAFADIRYANVSGVDVSGGGPVGGLVGFGENADIRDAYMSGVDVSGEYGVGGLVGSGPDAEIRYAYVSGGSVNGSSSVGGLVGSGLGFGSREKYEIRYAYVSGVDISGEYNVGGLVGSGPDAEIRYAYVSGGSVTGDDDVGGLVGFSGRADIYYAYVSGVNISGSRNVGGLVGYGWSLDIRYSYAAPGRVSGASDVGGLIGLTVGHTTVISSYWDIQTTGQSTSVGGSGRTTVRLQGMSFTGIYESWGNFWCNPNTGEEMKSTFQPPGFVRVWDLGTGSQYPALNCMPGGLLAQVRVVDAFPDDACASRDMDNDGDPDSVVAGCPTNLTADTDNDDVPNEADAFPLDACASRDTDNDGDPDSVVAGCQTDLMADAFPLDACASRDTDNDGDPDSVVAGCQTNLTADRDDDDDDVNDVDKDDQPLDNCPLLANADQNNTDKVNDGGDVCDVDDNNNGLIEIHTLDDWARLRDDLNGDGADDGNIAEITAVGSAGCPSSGCLGYELTRSLSFSLAGSYENNSGNLAVWTNRSGSGWEPIGSCFANTNTDTSTDIGCIAYTGVFDGGNYAVADLFVSAGDDAIGVGLFGAFAGRLQNLHLLNVHISGGAFDVGGLVGYGEYARYENLSVTDSSVMSPSAEHVGGLVGNGGFADIRYANVSGVDVSGSSYVGGLAGNDVLADIRYANVSGVDVSGSSYVGGLVGNGDRSDIRDAYVSGGSVTGTRDKVGGLVGGGWSVDIRDAYVSGGSVAGDDKVGGLVGNGRFADIRYAYVSGGSVTGTRDEVGGLVGGGWSVDIRDAYVSSVDISGRGIVGGLVGSGRFANIRYAYVSGGSVAGTGSSVGGLVGGFIGMATDDQIVVNASYWDTDTIGQSTSAFNSGDGKTTVELQSPTGFMGIYADWGNFWCSPDTGEEMESTSQPAGFVRVWDLGNRTQYPALNCMPGGLSAQGRVDAFPGDDCASADTDRDGDPDNLVPGCQTDLTVDSDDDNDKVIDTADTCPRGDMGWISNTTTDNDGDGCRDEHAEDPDDDNDGVADDDDVFPLDACASRDTDNDGDPDSVVAGCQTGLTADLDDDDDGVNDVDEDGHLLDNCPLLANADQNNTDKVNDGGDACDVDDNNNGLIEIHTLDELARLRDDLNGDGMDDGNIDEITAVGSAGCPISGCLGYELIRSLNFSLAGSYENNSGNFAVWTNGSGWVPIGLCFASYDDNDNVCSAYTGVFDGGDYTLADLFVSAGDDAIGVGLFGAFRGRLQNLHLLNAGVSGGSFSVGGLVGYGKQARYENLSVTGSSVMSPSAHAVGGLVGSGYDAEIRYVNVSGVDISGGGIVGGLVGSSSDIRYGYVSGGDVSIYVDALVGRGQNADIRYVYVSGVDVSGGSVVGGLVGSGHRSDIRYVYVSGADVSGSSYVGGLVGYGRGVNIRYAYVSGGSVTGTGGRVGGMVGNGRFADIRYASVSGGDVSGRSEVGGLVGAGWNADIRYAYVSGGDVSGGDDVGGLVGSGYSSDIRYAYVSGGNVSGRGEVGGLVGHGHDADIRYAYVSGVDVSGRGNCWRPGWIWG